MSNSSIKERVQEETIRDIVEDYLIRNGYDGLYSTDLCCGCKIGDLFRCRELYESCTPGFLVKCEGCGDFDYCISPDGICGNGEA